ncbi:MAG: hypothetical protein Tsb0021_10800 [Chlamydiales bacterium]
MRNTKNLKNTIFILPFYASEMQKICFLCYIKFLNKKYSTNFITGQSFYNYCKSEVAKAINKPTG